MSLDERHAAEPASKSWLERPRSRPSTARPWPGVALAKRARGEFNPESEVESKFVADLPLKH
jgi:hypothetical protein